MYVNRYIDYNPEYTDIKNLDFIVGSSKFSDDVWDFSNAKRDGKPNCRYIIKFTHIEKTQIKFTTKLIVLNWCLYLKILSVKRKFDGLTKFIKFLESYYPEIKSYSQITQMIVSTYINWLLNFQKKDGSKLSATDIKFGTLGLKDLLVEGERKGWDVPQNNFWIKGMHNDLILKSPRCIKFSREKTTKKKYSNETIEKILSCALKDENIFVRSAIIIQTQIGLRISELISIKEGCLTYQNGEPFLNYETSKTKKGIVQIKKPVNALVVKAIEELDRHTKQLRMESGIKNLFVHKIQYDSKIAVMAYHTFTKNYLKPFIERWDITENGEKICLTSHYFRHFFAQGAWKGGMTIKSIAKMLEHESLVMTETYTYNLQDELNRRFAEIMSNPQNLTGIGVGKFQERLNLKNPFQGKTEREIKIIIDAMRVKILSNGICMHHPARREDCPIKDGQKCIHCSNYVSPKICIPVHKVRIERLQDEIIRAEKQGNTIWSSKLKEEKDYIHNNFVKPFE